MSIAGSHHALPRFVPHVPSLSVRADVLVFRVAMGLIALHSLDYAFVSREPGTVATDHLLSGLVPSVVAILLAVAYPRMRAGARASIELSIGGIAAVGGVGTSARHALSQGLGGDDLTGILVALAGAALIVEGAIKLWETRRLDERPLRRYARRALIAIGAWLLAMTVLLPIAVATIATHRVRWDVPAVNLGAIHQDVRFTTSDGIALTGWYVPSRNGAAIVVSPGRSAEVQAHARMLARHGYGVLVFDRRGEGREGDFNAFGWAGERDLRAAVAFLAHRPGVDPDRIGGLGLSVGGEMLLQTAARDTALRAVASEGAGVRSVAEEVHRGGLAQIQAVPKMAVMTAATIILGNDTPPADLATLTEQIAPRATFFVYAKHGMGGEELNRLYHERAGYPKLLWEIPELGHTDGLTARPAEYEARVVAFFDRSL